ncbi:MAG: hypothetical protein K6T65_01105 [Peptococcaceae bacterium]|nr:hypothetical protein [Peptococcaceae bacterium]
MHPSLYTENQWQVMMFWYAVLTSIGGGFLMITIVISGYRHLAKSLNPGVRVSFIEDVQRAVLTMAIIALAPVFVNVLSGINDGLVWLFGKMVNFFAADTQVEKPALGTAVGMFEKIVAAPFKTVIEIFNTVFGLKNLDYLVFNGQTKVFGSLTNSIETGNPIADVVLNGAISAFTVYFNALYTMRKWVLSASLIATPIIAWVWAMTAERQILEIWVAEIIQTIFMQTTHALSLGIFVSIMTFTGTVAGSFESTEWLSGGFIRFGVYLAGFAGAICVYVIVLLGTRLIFARSSKARSETLEGMGTALLALLILGLSVAVASFLAYLLSGGWGVK